MSIDLTKDVIYRAFAVNDSTVRSRVVAGKGAGSGIDGCVIDSIDISPLDVTQFREKRSLQDGVDVGDVYLGGRTVRMRGTIYATSRASLFDQYQRLRAIMAPTLAFRENLAEKGYLPLYFSRPTLRTDDYPDSLIELRLRVMPETFVCDIDRDTTGGEDTRPLALPWTATMFARQPTIQSAQPIIEPLALASSPEGQEFVGDAGSDILTAVAHGLTDDDDIFFTRLVGGDPLEVGVRYFVVNATTDTFQVTESPGGLPIDFTVDITGAIHVVVSDELTRLNPTAIYVAGPKVSDATLLDLAAFGTVSRKSGSNYYATAAAVSAATFAPGVDWATIVNIADHIGGITAAFYAAKRGGPVLFVGSTIPAETRAELARLNPDNIKIIGTTASIPDTMKTALGAYTAGAVSRITGISRYALAAAASALIFSPSVGLAYIYDGSANSSLKVINGALAAAAAGVTPGPVLPVLATSIPATIKAELVRLNPDNIIIVGDSPNAAVETLLASYTGGTVARYAGASLYETSALLSTDFYGTGAPVMWVTDAATAPDSTVAAAAAASAGTSLLLMASGAIPTSTGRSAFVEPVTESGTLTNRGDYHVPVNMLLRVVGDGAIYASIGDSSFTITVPDSDNPRIFRFKGEDKVLTVEEEGIEALRQDLIVFDGDSTWPLLPSGDSPYSLTLAGVSIVGA